jgi:hypothetical protein
MSQKRSIHKVNIPYYNVYTSFWDTYTSQISGSHGGEYERGCLLGCYAI